MSDQMTNLAISVAETAASLMDSIHSMGRADEFHDTRHEIDGRSGMHIVCALVALAAERKFSKCWLQGIRDYINDCDRMAARLMEWVISDDPLHFIENEPDAERFIQYFASADYTVTCKFCGKEADANTAHIHQSGWVGDECCWDERLRSTE